MSYVTLKAFHLIFVISWFAGLFYIFRLFVYHVQNWDQPQTRATLTIMEFKLLRYIMLPAGLGSLVFGLALLLSNPALLAAGWLYWKFLFVLLLFAYHAYAELVHRRMTMGHRVLSEKSCRIINEVPTVALIAISVLVFLKP